MKYEFNIILKLKLKNGEVIDIDANVEGSYDADGDFNFRKVYSKTFDGQTRDVTAFVSDIRDLTDQIFDMADERYAQAKIDYKEAQLERIAQRMMEAS